jgi:hypothetical protein
VVESEDITVVVSADSTTAGIKSCPCLLDRVVTMASSNGLVEYTSELKRKRIQKMGGDTGIGATDSLCCIINHKTSFLLPTLIMN